MGITLGSDHCGEHECGIKGIHQTLGILEPKEICGIERRRIGKVNSSELVFLDEPTKKKSGQTILIIGETYQTNLSSKNLPSALKGNKNSTNLICAWGANSIGICAKRPEDRVALRSIYEALKSGDLAVWLGGAGPFQNAGLALGIISQVSEEHKKTMMDSDLDFIALAKASLETGIKELLDKAEKKFYTLSPRWANTIKSTSRGELKTIHKVIYWLNPLDQHQNNYGYYTVEELRKWAKDEGPIPCKNLII